MAVSAKKLKLLYIIDILKNYSDEEHPISAAEICERLDKMDITAERKSIYDDIETLTYYGFDIVKCHGRNSGCFLASREFELPEIYLLSDAVRAAKFISAKKTRELVTKLDSMLSTHQLKEREKGIFFDVAGKCDNEEIYYNIDTISRAVNGKKQIKFKFSVRELSADRSIVKNTKEMIISPYAMTWQDDHYYLIGNYSKYDNLIHIRVDRMRTVEILPQAIRPFSEVSDYTDTFDVADYTKKLFSMHGGKLEKIELRCNKKIIEQVIDRFSDNIFIKKVTDNEFSFSVEAAVSDALVTWIINYGDKITVTEPEQLRQMVRMRAQNVLNLYD